MPAGRFGLFFFGDGQVNVPLAGSLGRLCVGGQLRRLPVIQAEVLFGSASYTLDFAATGNNASVIGPGSVWNVQYWFRGVSGGVATSNTSDGLSVTFGP